MPLYKIPKSLCFFLLLMLMVVVSSVVFFNVVLLFLVIAIIILDISLTSCWCNDIDIQILVTTAGCGIGLKNCFFSQGPISREKANLHRKCKKRNSENIRHSQNQLLSAVCSSKCKKMLWGRDLLFPAPKMFFAHFLKNLVVRV